MRVSPRRALLSFGARSPPRPALALSPPQMLEPCGSRVLTLIVYLSDTTPCSPTPCPDGEHGAGACLLDGGEMRVRET